jgi:hypothetical protein
MQRESAPVLVDDESTDGGEEALPFGGAPFGGRRSGR